MAVQSLTCDPLDTPIVVDQLNKCGWVAYVTRIATNLDHVAWNETAQDTEGTQG